MQTSLDFRQFHFGCLIIFQALNKSLKNKLSGCRPFNSVVYASHFTHTHQHIPFIRFPSSISSAIFSSLCLSAARSRQCVHAADFSINMPPFTSTESHSWSRAGGKKKKKKKRSHVLNESRSHRTFLSSAVLIWGSKLVAEYDCRRAGWIGGEEVQDWLIDRQRDEELKHRVLVYLFFLIHFCWICFGWIFFFFAGFSTQKYFITTHLSRLRRKKHVSLI